VTDHLIATGFVFGLPKDHDFDPSKPYTCCLLCGAVYQGALDLKVPPGHEPKNSILAKLAKNNRDNWADLHARTDHTPEQHQQLRQSGRFATPDAAQRLSALGIFSLNDLVMDDEIKAALANAKPFYDMEIRREL
jgi:hypothetical protein